MKTKVLLLALLSGFVFSVTAQEYQPQVGFSNEAGYKTNFKKNKSHATIGLFQLRVAQRIVRRPKWRG